MSAICEERVITLWFGSRIAGRYQARPEPAAAYASAMHRRYPSLRVTNDPAPAVDRAALRRMPGERLWDEAPALT
jgi:hypothetical protein